MLDRKKLRGMLKTGKPLRKKMPSGLEIQAQRKKEKEKAEFNTGFREFRKLRKQGLSLKEIRKRLGE